MSRLGKQHLVIPTNTTVSVVGDKVTVKGPLGELVRVFRPEVSIMVEGDHVKFEPTNNSKFAKSLWGTVASHVGNMIDGVNKPFVKELLVEGVGFKSEVSGNELVMSLGFSHQVRLPIPSTLKVTAEKNVITISGNNIEDVGQFAAFVRKHKKPEPYKGKGIRYRNEVIRRKEGKKSA
jgi:large subunit ribosomal protein L6